MSTKRTGHDPANTPALIGVQSYWLDNTIIVTAYLDHDGSTTYVVANTTDPGTIPSTPPAHERTGRLPQATRAKINPCRGRAAGRRRPCQLPAIGTTGACAYHQDTP